MIDEHPSLQPASERIALEERLDWVRANVVAAIADLTDAQAAARPLPKTAMSVGGIVKHLATVEHHYFVAKLLGEPKLADPESAWATAADDSVAELVAGYEAACARSRAAAATFDSLDDLAAAISFGKEPASLRWMLVGVTSETSWHLGHLDLLRDALLR